MVLIHFTVSNLTVRISPPLSSLYSFLDLKSIISLSQYFTANDFYVSQGYFSSTSEEESNLINHFKLTLGKNDYLMVVMTLLW